MYNIQTLSYFPLIYMLILLSSQILSLGPLYIYFTSQFEMAGLLGGGGGNNNNQQPGKLQLFPGPG